MMDERYQAYEMFKSIVRQGKYSNLAAKELLQGSKEDKRLVHATVMGALDKLIYLDYVIRAYAKGRIRPVVHDILRLGVYQLLFMDIPSYAVCSEWTGLAGKLGKGAQKGYINGVLRAVSRDAGCLPLPDKISQPEKYLSVKYSYPEFLVKESVAERGFEETEKMLSYQPEYYTSVRFNQRKISREDFIKELDRLDCQYKPGLLYKDVFLIKGNKIFQDNLFKSGICSVQSEPSVLVCNVANPVKNSRVLDCCAAPGGKSVYMAQLMGSGELIALDKYEHRVKLIKANAARCGLEDIIKAGVWDASEFNDGLGLFDAVLVDAPCSGLGVTAGKPDIKLRVTPESLCQTEALQKSILNTAARYVRPGGALVYSTCTIRSGENQLQAERFLKEHGDFEADCAYKYAPGALLRREGDFISLMPHIDNTEGFFIARFIRKDN